MAIERDSIKLAPSILAADFARLAEQVAEADKAGADRIHVDVMDGHFVPNLSMGVPVVQSLRHITRLPLETNLMIRNPDQSLEAFASAGSDFFGCALGGEQQYPSHCPQNQRAGKTRGCCDLIQRPRPRCWKRSFQK